MVKLKVWSVLCVLLAGALTFSCSNEIPEGKPVMRKGRTVLAYLVANNASFDLDSNLKDNVIWMYEALSSMEDTCTLLVYYRPNSDDRTFDGPTLMEFVSDGSGNVNGLPSPGENVSFDEVVEIARKKVYPSDNSYVAVDPQVMRQVFLDMQEAAPSESYGLIFGSHASSWIKGGKTVQSKAFGDDNGYSINLPELADVLLSSFSQKLDFLLFDACMMGTAEVAYELREATDYLIGSVMETPIEGFPYRSVLPRLYGDVSGFSQVCNDFISFNRENYVNRVDNAWGTCALVDCSKADKLANAVGAGLETYKSELSDLDYENDIQQYGGKSYKNFSFDVGDFFRVLNSGQIPENIQSALNEAVAAKACLSGAAYEFEGVTVDENRFCGIGMYFPDRGIKDSWDEYYRASIAWYQAAGWERYLPSASE